MIGLVCGLLIMSAFLAGCTSSTSTPVTTQVTPAPVPATTAAASAAPVIPVTTESQVTTTATPAPDYTYSEGNVVAYTAASLSGVSPQLASDFERMYPGHKVTFNLAGTQALKTQIQNGAYADVFISASQKYTTELTSGGYFMPGTVKQLTTNYVIVILPKDNPGNIKELADLAKPGLKIAMADSSVPVGTATVGVMKSLAKTPALGKDWNTSVYNNVVTYETSEPAVANKVQLGEVDAGFVYESTYNAGVDKYQAINIAKAVNYLQTYQIAILKGSTSKGAAADFETFMLSELGQQDLKDFGFRAP